MAIVAIVMILLLFNYTIQLLIMNEIDKELATEVKNFNSFVKNKEFDLQVNAGELRKDLSFVVVDKNNNGIYMEAFSLEDSALIIEEISDAEKEVFDVVIVPNKRYHLMMSEIPRNSLFPNGSRLIVAKDISYISNTRYFSSYIMAITMLVLITFFVTMINFTMEKIFNALRELDDFGVALQGERVPDLSLRFNKRYGNNEIDTLINTLNHSIATMEDSFKKMEEFSSNVSHELKTPMTSMKSMIEIELSKDRTKEEYQETLIKVLEEMDWLIGITKDLLTLTKNPQGIQASFEPVNLSKVGGEICDIMEIIAIDEDIDLKWDFSAIEDELVMGDSSSIKQAIMNIINNSVKYNKKNGSVWVYGEKTKELVKIVVEDSGIGIKKENISRLTERFFREDSVRTVKKSGVGLGLSLVKHIIHLHRGELEIYSEEGVGSIFKISLPRYSEGG
ncbi:sensor histidine kinase [Ilyobacter polytropus]|uniref:histidine kinase n=1 Tax=Ilyobacter polytropus (strain ATCC 51220 / DSM 2926 / LMG 16218 / CuHBu1) TaxID=572544 RepID=E3HC88_ILYPC|nr:ATP-binding protein [Ilyobacter polytropus]ADO83931.1 integral membrane sensor signal transduction histidine kinase [Ilyobacter polytropus DSM 2926]